MKIFVPPIKSQGIKTKLVEWIDTNVKETNRNAVYEALLSNVELRDSISNSEMKLRIKNNKSCLTSKTKTYDFPEQLLLKLEEKTVANIIHK